MWFTDALMVTLVGWTRMVQQQQKLEAPESLDT